MIAATWRTVDTALLLTVLILLTLSGFFALAETALVRMSRSKAAALHDEKRRGSAALERLAVSPDKFLNPLLLLILVCQLVSATLVGVLAEHQFGAAGLAVATALEVVVIFVIFEAIPKNFAVMHGDSSALLAAPIIEVILRFWPIKWISMVLLSLAHIVLKPFGNPDESHKVTESEIIAMATVAHSDDSIDRSERDFIRSMLLMGDTIVREIMMPRIDMLTVRSDQTVQEALDCAVAEGRSRFPVLGEDIDDIIGVVNLRGLLKEIKKGNGEKKLAEVTLDEPNFIPETRKVDSLLQNFRKAKKHLFIVVDEYGSTAGIVTLEDVLEEVVGQIIDEHDDESPEVELDESVELTWPRIVNARLNIDDVNTKYQLDLPTGNYDTVAGLVLDLSGGVPEVGDVFEVDHYSITVDKMDRHRIEQVSILLAADQS